MVSVSRLQRNIKLQIWLPEHLFKFMPFLSHIFLHRIKFWSCLCSIDQAQTESACTLAFKVSSLISTSVKWLTDHGKNASQLIYSTASSSRKYLFEIFLCTCCDPIGKIWQIILPNGNFLNLHTKLSIDVHRSFSYRLGIRAKVKLFLDWVNNFKYSVVTLYNMRQQEPSESERGRFTELD